MNISTVVNTIAIDVTLQLQYIPPRRKYYTYNVICVLSGYVVHNQYNLFLQSTNARFSEKPALVDFATLPTQSLPPAERLPNHTARIDLHIVSRLYSYSLPLTPGCALLRGMVSVIWCLRVTSLKTCHSKKNLFTPINGGGVGNRTRVWFSP